MGSHPYISGAGNITQIVGLLRKNFPASVTSETVKKFGLASNNESYVINALQFIGLINEDGRRTERGRDALSIHDEEGFRNAFAGIIRDAYKDLFDLRGDDAWTLPRGELIGFFRTSDKTSEVIGTRQASVFRAFAALAGYTDATVTVKTKNAPTPPVRPVSSRGAKKKRETRSFGVEATSHGRATTGTAHARDMALTVRIEINLPTDGTRETYDNIFQSIRANLINE